jgi:hypothetical protein
MIPATTIWMTGIKYENNVFNRQKFVYRRVFDCLPLPIPLTPCDGTCKIFSFNCNKNLSKVSLTITPLSEQLNFAYSVFLTQNGLVASDCLSNTIKTKWFVILSLENDILIKEYFFEGFGLSDNGISYPSEQQWKTAIIGELNDLNLDGFGYFIEGNDLYIRTLGCDDQKNNKKLKLNIGIELSANCI